MHKFAMFLLPKSMAGTSMEAREVVYSNMLSRVDEDGMDWFIIGGRFSGELTRMRMKEEELEEFMDRFEEKYGWCIDKDNSEEKKRKQEVELLKEMGLDKYIPEGTDCIFWRDKYKDYGYEDDAQILDDELYKKIKEILSKKGLVIREHLTAGAVIFLDGRNELSQDCIGKYWVVVVDYHS